MSLTLKTTDEAARILNELHDELLDMAKQPAKHHLGADGLMEVKELEELVMEVLVRILPATN